MDYEALVCVWRVVGCAGSGVCVWRRLWAAARHAARPAHTTHFPPTCNYSRPALFPSSHPQVLDFVDPDIDAKLAALEREEEAQAAAAEVGGRQGGGPRCMSVVVRKGPVLPPAAPGRAPGDCPLIQVHLFKFAGPCPCPPHHPTPLPSSHLTPHTFPPPSHLTVCDCEDTEVDAH